MRSSMLNGLLYSLSSSAGWVKLRQTLQLLDQFSSLNEEAQIYIKDNMNTLAVSVGL